MTKFQVLSKILAAFSISFAATLASAAITPVSINIVPGAQFPPSDFGVTGARLSALIGRNSSVSGIDVGLLGNITSQDFNGVAISGLFNATNGSTKIYGFQLAGLTNINTNKTDVYGIQGTLGINSNTAAASVIGLQLGLLANIAPFTDVYGFQIGLYNRANTVHGFQIGLVNVTNSLHGVQIGLVNVNNQGLFRISPVLNVGF